MQSLLKRFKPWTMRKIYAALFLMLFAFTAKAQFPAPYCAELFPDGVEPITNVVFNTINNTSSATITLSGDVHQNFTAISTTVQRGSSYTIQVKGNTGGPYQDYIAAFIDFNNNGVFTDAGESFAVGILENTTGIDDSVISAIIAIPPTATIGSIRMRVSKKYGEFPAPCNVTTPGIGDFGQAEDYTLTVVAATPCSGMPNGGGVSPTAGISCGGGSVTLTSTASNTGSGLSYQWQLSAAGTNNFTNISGATFNTFAAAPASNTDYRVIITCTGSGISATSTSARISTSTVPANDSVCFAIPLTLNGAATCGNTACATGYGTMTAGVAGNPAFSKDVPNNTLWYTFTPTTTGSVQFKFKRPAGVTSGLLNGWLAMYTVTGTCPFTFTEVPANIHYDLTTSDTVLALSPILMAGTQYYLMVDGANGGSGAFCMQVNTASPPVNDNCAAAIAIAPGSTLFGTTVGASQSLPASRCSGSSGSDATSARAYDVWYNIKTLSNGTFTISVTGDASFDAVLGIYRGTCSTLTFDTCRDATFDGGTESITVMNAVAGTNYLIRVYSYYNTTDSVSSFTISTSGTSLPVTGLVLAGVRNGSKTQLSWQTLTETNNAGFELQRSADGKYFSGIANIASKANSGNSTAAISYSTEDAKPFSGANYYRLKQTDKDGKTSYSNIVYLKGAAVSTLTLSAVYPNPTKDVLKAAIQAPAAESITFMVSDMMGKTISRQVSTVVSGDNTININVANLPSGSYLLKAVCRNGCESAYQKFTKQ